jgi:hypothetical protein
MQLFESVSRWFSDIPAVRRVRNGPRVDVNGQALLRAIGESAIDAALLRNLSMSGACIRCDLRLERGDLLQIRANAGTDDEFEFTASVVAVRPSALGFFTDYGLRLVELNVESARVMQDFINRRINIAQTMSRDPIPQ